MIHIIYYCSIRIAAEEKLKNILIVRLKETMRVMGLGNAVHWCSWFIDSFAVMFGSCVLLTIILVVSSQNTV